MPQSIKDAVISAEDKDFYSHPGFDPLGIVRAAWRDLVLRRAAQGGSTITQQLVKNVYAGTYTTNRRRRAGLHRAAAHDRSEDPRSPARGQARARADQGPDPGEVPEHDLLRPRRLRVQAAAQTYYREDASDLTCSQSATLAGMIAAPTSSTPRRAPATASSGATTCLDRMAAKGYLTPDRATQLKAKPVKTDPVARAGLPWPDRLLRSLHEVVPAAAVLVEPGVRRRAPGDDQARPRHAARRREGDVDAPPDGPTSPQAALVAIDPRDGEVRAMVGGSSYDEVAGEPRDRQGSPAAQAGSAFKPFTLAAAMEQGYSLNSHWSGPSTITINDPRCDTNGQPWQPSQRRGRGERDVHPRLGHRALGEHRLRAARRPGRARQRRRRWRTRWASRSTLEPVCSIALGSAVASRRSR